MFKRGTWRKKFLTKDWRDEIKVGDILISKMSGTDRIVREISYDEGGFINCIWFSILRCTRFRAPHTIYLRTEIDRLFKPTGASVNLGSREDKKILAAIRRGRNGDWELKTFYWDVVGVIR